MTVLCTYTVETQCIASLQKIFRIVILLLLLEIPLFSEGPADINFQLDNGVLSRYDSCEKIVLYDSVAAIHRSGDTLYYIRNSGESWLVGFLKGDSHRGIEFNVAGNYKAINKFYCEDNIFYFLAQQTNELPKNNRYDLGRIFVRFNSDKNNFNTTEGVVDFHIIEGKPLILRYDSLNYNDSDIPIMLRGRMEISGVFDSRIVIIKGMADIEIVDLIAGKSIYQFNKNSIADYNDKYNLILEFEDSNLKASQKTEDQSIYYEIIIDGVEDSRTETGSGDLSKLFYKKLSSGENHTVKAVRWELDREKGRYVRMNNIYQPDEVKIFIPDNRIIKLRIEFDGKTYSINQSVEYK
ncbi:MAG: hypothetical protein FWH53_03250 [Leptospirales bacterium]|nr:hypothetical protein [Leptospirales bacterium]